MANAEVLPDLGTAVTQPPRASRGFTDCSSFHKRAHSTGLKNVLKAVNDPKGETSKLLGQR